MLPSQDKTRGAVVQTGWETVGGRQPIADGNKRNPTCIHGGRHERHPLLVPVSPAAAMDEGEYGGSR